MQKHIHKMYEGAVKQVLTGRELEAAVLRKAALRLKTCRAACEQAGPSGELLEALRMNQSIWSILQTELLDTNNPLPQPLRLNLLKLSKIVDRETMALTAQPSVDKLELLIDINLGIAEGLLANRNQPLPMAAQQPNSQYALQPVCA